MKLFVFGSSLLSSYWNGAATYYRGIYRALHQLGHQVSFAEPDAFHRQQHLDPGDYSYADSIVYRSKIDLHRMLEHACAADVVIKHSGIGSDDEELESLVLECRPSSRVIFWDVDAPATISRMREDPTGGFASIIGRYDGVFTYGGGPRTQEAYEQFGARNFSSIYNGLDPSTHFPVPPDPGLRCDLAFVGNRLPDREQRVEELFLRAASLAPEQVFLLGGEGWDGKALPSNVRWIGHVPTGDHNRVNCSARMVLNINRASMASFGYSPPTRVFEVAGSGTCLLCDDWPGMREFFEPGKEVLIVRSAEEIVGTLRSTSALDAQRCGNALRERAMRDHTYDVRGRQIESALLHLLAIPSAAAEPDKARVA
jgi:spore maturation protein CgeB